MQVIADDERGMGHAAAERRADRGRLTREARARGGRNRWAGVPSAERGREMFAIARARWAKTTAEARQRVGLALVEARRAGQRFHVPMMPARGWIDSLPQPCERCRRAASPYLRHPLRTHAVPTWRCSRHAWAPRHEYESPAYRAPFGHVWITHR